MRVKLFIVILFAIILPIGIAQNDQSHPLSQIKPIDTNLDMFKFNITNVTFVGINLTNPQYVLDVAGDVRWSGTLRGGIVPWNLLSGYNLNVQWSGLLGWGNLTGYNLNVNWMGKLGWGNLTNYPSIITQIGSGLNASTQSLANNVILGVNFTEVQKRVTGSCSGSNAIQVINADGSVVCVDINLYGNVTGTGTSGYIPLWQTSSSLNNSLINQTNGNIWITSGNLNIVSGALQIGGTTVIDSSRNLTGINWVKQNLQFDILRSANSYGLVWSGLTDSYKIYVNETAGSETTNLIIEYADNADQDNVIFRMVPYGGAPKNVLTLRYSDIIANATFRPLINNLIDLGTSSNQWANIYGMNIYQNNKQVIDTINANAPLTSSKIGGSVTIALTTPLALNYGGTGADLSVAGNYIIVKSGNSLTASPVDLASNNFTGVLPASKGGTGISGAGGVANRVLLTTDGSTWQAGLVNLANMVTGVLPISSGGTGASNANTARVNLQASGIGNCPQGYAVMNLTTGAPECIPVATPSSANVTGAGSPGQIAFWVGSTTLSGDGNLIWDNSAKRLGISVSSPQAKLHVSGDVIIDV
jgi:hypothetical protein